jgi:hypothetical protein
MSDEYYLEPFGRPDESYEDYDDVNYNKTKFMRSAPVQRYPTREIPREAFPYPFVDRRTPKDSAKLFNYCGTERMTGAVPAFSQPNVFLFVFIMLIFMCFYTMYGVIRIHKELSKIRKLLANRG